MYINSRIRDRIRIEDAKNISSDNFYDLVVDIAKSEIPGLSSLDGSILNIFDILDYGIPSKTWEKLSDIRYLDNWSRIKADACPGGSEGMYLDIYLVTFCEDTKEYISTNMFTFKTLEEGPEAYAAMGALGGMISYIIEMFLIYNI